MKTNMRDGFIVYIVAVVIAILALGGLSLLNMSVVDKEATRLRGDEMQVEQIAKSGVEAISAFAGASKNEQQALGGLYNNPAVFQNVLMLPVTSFTQHRGNGRFSVLAGTRYGLFNESAKLHLGTVLRWESEKPGKGVSALLKLPGMTPSSADSILDWLDADKKTRSSGAEIDYYSRIGVPYGPRNAVPPSLEELLLVRDVTRKLLFGQKQSEPKQSEPFALQTVPMDDEFADPFEAALQSPAASLQPDDSETLPWMYLLTTLSAEKDVDPNGMPRRDLNEPNLEFLHGELSSTIGSESADFVILYRQFGPAEIEAASQIQPTISRSSRQQRNRNTKNTAKSSLVDFSTPSAFRIENPLDLANVSVKQTDGAIFSSPFRLSQGSVSEEMLLLLDFATVNQNIVTSGRININEAPKDVLRAIPGFDEQIVSRIISERGTDESFRHPVWLVVAGIFDIAELKTFSPEITTGGDVFRAQIVAHFENIGIQSRIEVVVDATVFPPRQVFYKDLSLEPPPGEP